MPKKILHFPTGWTPDDDDPEGRAFWDAMHPRETDVSAMHPLEIWLDREFLLAETQASIDAAKRNIPWDTATPVQRDHFKAILQQRVEFLEYLNGETSERVFVALYPMATDLQFTFGEEADADDMPPSGGSYGHLGNLDDIEGDDDLPL